MIYADIRADFLGGIFRSELELSGEPLESVTGKRVLIVVPGVKNTQAQIRNACREIVNRAHAAADVGVGFIWPSGTTPLGWPIARSLTTDASAHALADLVKTLRRYNPTSVDIDAHSLGCKVTLDSLKHLEPNLEPQVDGLWLMAAAVPRSLERYREDIWMTVKHPTHVFYSRRDLVLTVLFQAYPPWLPALGAYGESGKDPVAIGHDCTREVLTHNAYRHSNIVVAARSDEANRRARLRDWVDSAIGGHLNGL